MFSQPNSIIRVSTSSTIDTEMLALLSTALWMLAFYSPFLFSPSGLPVSWAPLSTSRRMFLIDKKKLHIFQPIASSRGNILFERNVLAPSVHDKKQKVTRQEGLYSRCRTPSRPPGGFPAEVLLQAHRDLFDQLSKHSWSREQPRATCCGALLNSYQTGSPQLTSSSVCSDLWGSAGGAGANSAGMSNKMAGSLSGEGVE